MGLRSPGLLLPIIRLLGASSQVAERRVLPQAKVGEDGAYIDCPCARVRPNLSHPSLTTVFPPDYGTYCASWDADGIIAACRNIYDRPRWCDKNWCYMDRGNCSRTVIASEFALDVTYSYAACGDIYSTADTLQLAGRKVLVGDVFQGSYVSVNPVASSPGLRTSLIFANELFQHMGIMADEIDYRELSNASLIANPASRFTACVYDVGIGNLDLCIGNFWLTDDRLLWRVPFVGLYQEQVMLVTKRDIDEEDLWAMLYKPCSPFSPSLWGVIIIALITSALVMAFLEHGHAEGFTNDHSHETVAHAVYATLLGFFSGGIAIEPETLSGRIMALGSSFFIMICTASFTASTATVLIMRAQRTKVQDLEDALATGLTVCYLDGLRLQLQTKYPALASQGRIISDGDITQSLLDGHCEAALVSEPEIRARFSEGRLCEFMITGEPVERLFTGYYSSKPLYDTMMFATAQLRSTGVWARNERDLSPRSTCAQDATFAEKAQEFHQLSPEHFWGTLLMLAFSALLALLIRVVRKTKRRVTKDTAFERVEHEATSKLASAVDKLGDTLALEKSHHEDGEACHATSSSGNVKRRPASNLSTISCDADTTRDEADPTAAHVRNLDIDL